MHMTVLVTTILTAATITFQLYSQPTPSTPEELQLWTDLHYRYDSWREAVNAAPISQHARQAAQFAKNDAMAMIQQGDFGHGYAGRTAASMLARVGDNQDAVTVLRAVAAQPETSHDKMDGLRQLGQLYIKLNLLPSAEEVFRKAYDYGIDNWHKDSWQWSSSFVVCADSLATLYRARNRPQLAEPIYLYISSNPNSMFQHEDIQSAYLSLAKVQQLSGDTESVHQTLRHLFKKYPRLGIHDAGGINARLHYLELENPTLDTEEYVQSLETMWEHYPDLNGGNLLDVADRLARSRLQRNEIEAAITVRIEAIDRLRDVDPERMLLAAHALIDNAAQFGFREIGISTLMEADALYKAMGRAGYPSLEAHLARIEQPSPR